MKEMQFMLDIERALHADVDGSLRRALRGRLARAETRLRRALQQQHTPADNREINAALKAVEAGLALLRRYGG